MRQKNQRFSVKFLTTPVMDNAGRILKAAKDFKPTKQDQLDCNLYSSFSVLLALHQYDFMKSKALDDLINKLKTGLVVSVESELPTMFVDKEFVGSLMAYVKDSPPVSNNHKDFLYQLANSPMFSHLLEIEDTLWIFGNYFN